MAVIDTSMDMPKSCMSCQKEWCMYNGLPLSTKRHKNCPLKSTDEMIAEIEAIKDWALRYLPTEEKEQRPQIVRNVKRHIISIIHKYCDIKERKNEDIGIR